MERRLNVLWDAVRQVTYRLAMLALWLPYLLPIAAIAVLDGLMRRRIKLAEFGNSSPSVHRRYSLYTILALLYLLLLGLLLPLPLSPLVAPLMLGILIICINLLLANTPKRV
jgi:phosphatidylserine synthase